MTKDINIVSKVLVYEPDEEIMGQIKDFIASHDLVGLKATGFNGIMESLKQNIDLGAVFLSEVTDHEGKSGADIALEIHKIRQELPIFLRRTSTTTMEDLDPKHQKSISAVYDINDLDGLVTSIKKFIFDAYYPNTLVRGIQEISVNSIQAILRGTMASPGMVYLVHDRIIFGELYSLILLESKWCRGYMMLQTKESTMGELIKSGKTSLSSNNVDFRDVNSLMNELTNLMWGGFKSRFFTRDDEITSPQRTQVPIVVNHFHEYIYFGSQNPQLCFEYTLFDVDGKLEPITLYQKFVFNLNWAPEVFIAKEDQLIENLVNEGEIMFF